MMGDVAAKLAASPKAEIKRIAAEIEGEKAALHSSLGELGIQDPIPATLYSASGVELTESEGSFFGRFLDDPKNKIVAWDGRHRLEWAEVNGTNTIPVILVREAKGRAILEASVIGRRHWTKGQRAWLGVMQHPEVCEATQGTRSTDSVGTLTTAPALSSRLGVSADVVNQAVQLYRLFFAPGAKAGSPEAIEAATRKAKYEHLIWGGAGLGGVLAGIAGGENTGGKPKAPTGFHHLDAPLGSLTRLSKVWLAWDAEERAKAQALIVARVRGNAETAGWPDEFRQALAEALVAAD